MKQSLTLVFLLIPLAFAAEAETAQELTVQSNLIAELLILGGCFFILAAGIGMFRFPDFYTRLHASSKLVTLGGIGVFGGAAFAFLSLAATQRVLLTAVFFLLTAPLSGYMIARAGYLQGLKPYREDNSVDEWQACGAESES
ncbi:MAG: monovalent cation/H(+) antiporter subunit G [Trueperaceae bacterium]|nr:monovalent cation/H(+) antiporter subunit G [Trueperaceae bacterium]